MAAPNRNMMTIAIVLIVVILGYIVLTMPDRRTTSERVGDAISELPNGPDKAARELERRTPGEKLGDAVKDAGDDIKRSTSNP